MSSKILLIEDEENLREVIRLNLELEGYGVTERSDTVGLEMLLKVKHFDLVLLDIMLPGRDGFEACEIIKQFDQDLPVIFITARDSGDDRVRGLKTGADDYLPKPFHLEELILRVRNLIRRNSRKDHSEYFFDGHKIDFKRFECTPAGGNTVTVNLREAEILKLLVSRKGEVVSRDEILSKFWPDGNFPSHRVIDNYILNLRKIFEDKSLGKRYFHSIRGVGYKFSP